jgi:outer membrane protein
LHARITLLLLSASTMGATRSSLAQTQGPQSQQSMFAGQLGLGALSAPKYPGSDERWVLPIPIIDLRIAQRFYLGGGSTSIAFGAGMVLLERAHLSWTADLTLMPDRPEDRADALAGMGDRGFGVFGGTAVSVRAGPLQATGSVAQGFTDAGLSATAGLSSWVPLGGPFFGQVGGLVVWGDCQNLRWDFQITREQAARRAQLLAAGQPGLRPGDDVPYDPECGLREVRATSLAGVAFTQRLVMIASGTWSRLQGGAANSPLVRKPTSWEATIGVSWRI